MQFDPLQLAEKTGCSVPVLREPLPVPLCMVEMAKTNDLNTYKYLTYLLSQRSNDKMSDEQLEQLAPWSETVKANCQN